MQEMKRLQPNYEEEERAAHFDQNPPDAPASPANGRQLRLATEKCNKPADNVIALKGRETRSNGRGQKPELEMPYREAVCELCEKTVSLALGVPLSGMQAETRCTAEIALARQIAMYLSHTMFSLLLTEVGLHFGRDRSTVSHACALVEDKRDDLAFDVMICQLEALLGDAREAMALCFRQGCFQDAVDVRESVSGLSVYWRALLQEAP